jgi:squalene-associated FAD-dependent desaturase
MTGGAVHVIGGGLAGLAAATRLAAAGVDTVVHEAAGAAGGRCRSYFDPVLGADIDNGAHLLLSGNDAAVDYLQRIGSFGQMAGSDRAEFDFADLSTGQRWRLRPNEGRAPWWILDPKRRAPGTSLREHLALLAIFWPSAGGTVGEAMHCGGPLYDRLWRPLLLSALNTEPTISSARLASALVRGTLGRGGKACRPLVAVEGLSPTFVDPAIRFLKARGGKVNLDHRLRRLVSHGDRAVGLEFEGESLALKPEDSVIVAVPPWAARDLVAGIDTPDKFNGIVNAHFRISAPKGQPTILGVIGGLTQWLFAYRERLSVTISDAGDLIDWSRERLAQTIWNEVSTLTGLEAPLPPFRIVKEKRATFAATPEQDAKRPSARTSWSNVFLAGDWVQTGLPATIEGAVRSGYEAARLIAAARPGASLVTTTAFA